MNIERLTQKGMALWEGSKSGVRLQIHHRLPEFT
jgi:hypothetical protein